jgi:hypothetical protein
MARKPSAKSRFEANWEALWKMGEARTTSPSALSEEETSCKIVKSLMREFGRPVRTAFKKARLDIRNDYHWKILLLTLARAVYAKKVRVSQKNGPETKSDGSKRKLPNFKSSILAIVRRNVARC